MRRWIVWGLLVAFVWFVVWRFTQIEEMSRIIVRGRWEWILIAAALQCAFYVFFTGIFHSAFNVVGVRSRWLPLIPVTLAVVFVGTVAPGAGVSGLAVFVDDAKQRGQSAARAAAGTLLGQTADFVGFLPILIVGMSFLRFEHHLAVYQVVAAILMVALLGGLTVALTLGLWRPAWVHSLIRVPQRVANWASRVFRRPELFSDEWVAHTAEEFRLAAVSLSRRPVGLTRTVACAFLGHSVSIASLYCVFLAFREPVGFVTLVAGYSMGILFWIVSITPQGVGVVEAVMALVFNSFGVPIEGATVIAVAFRGLAFWIPMAIGAVTARRIAQTAPLVAAVAAPVTTLPQPLSPQSGRGEQED